MAAEAAPVLADFFLPGGPVERKRRQRLQVFVGRRGGEIRGFVLRRELDVLVRLHRFVKLQRFLELAVGFDPEADGERARVVLDGDRAGGDGAWPSAVRAVEFVVPHAQIDVEQPRALVVALGERSEG